MFRGCLDYFLFSSIYELTHVLFTKHLIINYIQSRNMEY